MNEGLGATSDTGATQLGTEGVPYRSEAAEALIAERMAELRASGRPADRMGVVRELAEKGRVRVAENPLPRIEQELVDSLPPEAQQRARASQEANNATGGRSLAEARSVAVADEIGRRQHEAARHSAGRTIELSEEDSREQRIKALTGQGYARWDAERRVEFQDRQRARQQR